MRVIVAGGRDFVSTIEDDLWLIDSLQKLEATEVICGGAKGADELGKAIGEMCGLEIKMFPANWERYGKSAGMKRNLEMAMYADSVILFPGGRGTSNMKKLAIDNNLKVIEYE